MSNTPPILYSFRRCPYAMRARMAINVSNIPVELREIVLKNKPAEMLEASPKGTVPVLVLPDGKVIDESRDIMMWALHRNDPENWYFGLTASQQEEIHSLIDINDHDFKAKLDKYKYAVRFPEQSELEYRELCETFLQSLDQKLTSTPYLLGEKITLADIAIVPFIRQFAHVDIQWFEQSRYQRLSFWLKEFKASPLFNEIMTKFPTWEAGDKITVF